MLLAESVSEEVWAVRQSVARKISRGQFLDGFESILTMGATALKVLEKICFLEVN